MMRALLLSSLLVGTVAFLAPIQDRVSTTSLAMSNALIVQNKGGGHGELGYQLAKVLKDKMTSITILQDEACKDEQEPFCSYGTDLPEVSVVKAPLGSEDMSAEQLQSILGEGTSFDYVWDNASKKPEGAGRAILDCAKTWGVQLYTYVSSAGMYQPDGTFPMAETTPIKESAGQNQMDQAAVALELPYVSFRPQYIYGPKANKYDYLDWFFDRIVRGLPLPIPGDGTQLVSLTHSEDVASLLASPLNDEAAAVSQRFFNCGTDKLVSYNEVAELCAKVAGKECTFEHYDADLLGKGTFPFRPTNFYVAPDMVKEKLQWPGASHSLEEDLSWYYEGYVSRGGPTKKMSLAKDWEIVVGCKTTVPGQLGSIYDQYDPLVLSVPE